MINTNFRPQKQLPREKPASKPTRQSNGRKKLLERDSTVFPTRWPRWHWRERALSRSPILSCDGNSNASPTFTMTVFCSTLLGRTWKAHSGACDYGASTGEYKQRNHKNIINRKRRDGKGTSTLKWYIFTGDIRMKGNNCNFLTAPQIYQASLIKNGICIACFSIKTTVPKPCQFNFVNSMLLVSLRINLKRGMGGRQFIVNSFCRMVYLKGYPGSNSVCCQKRSKRSSLKTKHTDQCVDKKEKTSSGFGFPSFKTCIYERNIRACSTNSPFRSHGVS